MKRPLEPGSPRAGAETTWVTLLSATEVSASDLVTWLDGHRDLVVQLPVVVEWTPLGVTGAQVGAVPVPGALRLRLDDSALGIALIDRVRQHCAEPVCAIRLEGRWHGEERFQVLRVVGPVAATDDAGIRVAVATGEVDGPMSGGWSSADPASDTIRTASQEVERLLRARTNDPTLTITRVASARTQVVAGTHYELVIDLNGKDGPKSAVRVLVWSDPQSVWTLTSVEGL